MKTKALLLASFVSALVIGAIAPNTANAYYNNNREVCVTYCANRNAAGGYCFQVAQFCGVNAYCEVRCNNFFLDGSCANYQNQDSCFSD